MSQNAVGSIIRASFETKVLHIDIPVTDSVIDSVGDSYSTEWRLGKHAVKPADLSCAQTSTASEMVSQAIQTS